MAKISLKQLQQLIREAVNEQLEEMGAKEGVDEVSGGIDVSAVARGAGAGAGGTGYGETFASKAIKAADNKDDKTLFDMFLKAGNEDDKKFVAQLMAKRFSEQYGMPAPGMVAEMRRNIRKSR